MSNKKPYPVSASGRPVGCDCGPMRDTTAHGHADYCPWYRFERAPAVEPEQPTRSADGREFRCDVERHGPVIPCPRCEPLDTTTNAAARPAIEIRATGIEDVKALIEAATEALTVWDEQPDPEEMGGPMRAIRNALSNIAASDGGDDA